MLINNYVAFILLLLGVISQATAQEPSKLETAVQGFGVAARVSGGPDAGGYTYYDQADSCSYEFVDISATGTLVVSGDDVDANVMLGGSALNLYGTLASQLNVSSNGLLATDLTGTSIDISNDCPIPAVPSTGGGDRLMVMHDDLIASVHHQYFSAPCPRPNDAGLVATGCDIFQWDGTYVSTGNPVRFQAIIYDGIEEIAYQYHTVGDTGVSSTTGLQNAAASTGLLYGCDTLNYVTPNTAVCIFKALPNPACGGADVVIDNAVFVPQTTFNCSATNSISTGSTGVGILPNAIVNFTAPRLAISPPFTVVHGGVFRFQNGTAPPPCVDPTDTDSDRLPDCVETNTGIFVDDENTGTDPNLADTDGDSIDDGDEVLGTLGGLNLPGMGTNPLRKNILLEYDWFDDSLDCAAHSHQPTAAAIAMVAQAFTNAPVNNPDLSTGITLIQDYGQGGLFTGGNLVDDTNGVIGGGVNGTEFKNHKGSNFASSRDLYFHYVLLPHRYNTNSGSSGQAELPGDDLIVSLYCFNTDKNVAHTILHELGHNLFIRHGGFENRNWKPNYNSVMNYKYQFPGTDTCADADPAGNNILDYSIGDRIDLDETDLDENQGTCGTLAWDWNGNTVIESSVSEEINSDSFLDNLQDYNDWANIEFGGLSDADGIPLVRKIIEVISCNNPAPAP